ncbi:hypothetical protein GCM10027175_19630 [Hymenobacter latericoloratus]
MGTEYNNRFTQRVSFPDCFPEDVSGVPLAPVLGMGMYGLELAFMFFFAGTQVDSNLSNGYFIYYQQ